MKTVRKFLTVLSVMSILLSVFGVAAFPAAQAEEVNLLENLSVDNTAGITLNAAANGLTSAGYSVVHFNDLKLKKNHTYVYTFDLKYVTAPADTTCSLFLRGDGSRAGQYICFGYGGQVRVGRSPWCEAFDAIWNNVKINWAANETHTWKIVMEPTRIQISVDNKVQIAEVGSDGNGWITLGAVEDGAIGFQCQGATPNVTMSHLSLVDMTPDIGDEDPQEQRPTVDQVKAAIAAIGTVDIDSITRIHTARNLFDKLTKEEQTQVDTVSVLTNAETALAEINMLDNAVISSANVGVTPIQDGFVFVDGGSATIHTIGNAVLRRNSSYTLTFRMSLDGGLQNNIFLLGFRGNMTSTTAQQQAFVAIGTYTNVYLSANETVSDGHYYSCLKPDTPYTVKIESEPERARLYIDGALIPLAGADKDGWVTLPAVEKGRITLQGYGGSCCHVTFTDFGLVRTKVGEGDTDDEEGDGPVLDAFSEKAYMSYLWKGDTAYQEPILFINNGGTVTGTLLYQPDEIISLRSGDLNTEYEENVDYTVSGRTITLTPGSRIPTVDPSAFTAASGAVLNKDGQYILGYSYPLWMTKSVNVTYTHSDTWTGATPAYQGERLPATAGKLAGKQPVKISFLGDSLTFGADRSPLIEAYPEMACRYLQTLSGSKVTCHNRGISGITIDSALQDYNGILTDTIADSPDLVVIAFGMNDALATSPAAFKGKISLLMSLISASCPETEFLIVSSIFPLPGSHYPDGTVFAQHLSGYAGVIAELKADGVATVDMNTYWQYLLQYKEYHSMGGNGLHHPNDYGYRLYAQVICATLFPGSGDPEEEDPSADTVTMCWPDGKMKAFTLAFDDGQEQDETLISIFRENGLKSTFYINTGRFVPNGTTYPAGATWRPVSQAKAVAIYKDSGMEVASHGSVHADLTKLDYAGFKAEILDEVDLIEDLFDSTVYGIAYAAGAHNDTVIRWMAENSLGYGRTAGSPTYSFDLPENWYEWEPTCHYADANLSALTNQFLKKGASSPKLFFVWGHGYEVDEGHAWQLIRDFAATVGGHDDVWYATNGEIYRYAAAYDRLIIDDTANRVTNPTDEELWFRYGGETYHVGADSSVKVFFRPEDPDNGFVTDPETGLVYYYKDGELNTEPRITVDGVICNFYPEGSIVDGVDVSYSYLLGWKMMPSKITRYYEEGEYFFKTGFQKAEGKHYFFDKTSGALYIPSAGVGGMGWYKSGDAYYALSPVTGEWIVGLYTDANGDTYYYKKYDAKAGCTTGLVTMDGETYYFDPADGKMVRDTTVDFGDHQLTFGADGAMTKAVGIYNGYCYDENGDLYPGGVLFEAGGDLYRTTTDGKLDSNYWYRTDPRDSSKKVYLYKGKVLEGMVTIDYSAWTYSGKMEITESGTYCFAGNTLTPSKGLVTAENGLEYYFSLADGKRYEKADYAYVSALKALYNFYKKGTVIDGVDMSYAHKVGLITEDGVDRIYEDGTRGYLKSTTRTVGGVTYVIDADGVATVA